MAWGNPQHASRSAGRGRPESSTSADGVELGEGPRMISWRSKMSSSTRWTLRPSSRWSGIKPARGKNASANGSTAAPGRPAAADATIVDGVPALPADTIRSSRGTRPKGPDPHQETVGSKTGFCGRGSVPPAIRPRPASARRRPPRPSLPSKTRPSRIPRNPPRCRPGTTRSRARRLRARRLRHCLRHGFAGRANPGSYSGTSYSALLTLTPVTLYTGYSDTGYSYTGSPGRPPAASRPGARRSARGPRGGVHLGNARAPAHVSVVARTDLPAVGRP